MTRHHGAYHLLLACLLSASVSGPPALAQTPSASNPAPIRAETRLVLVDATVRDKKGKIVNDLAVTDFQLSEDGKARPISSFALENLDSSEPQYVLFLFDNAWQKPPRQSVADIAGAYAAPNRYMAIANFSGALSIAQNFTSLADRVQRAALDTSSAPARNSSPGVPNVGAMQASGRGMGGLGGGQIGGAMVTGMAQYPLPVLDSLRDIADGMAALKGRKLIVVVGAGSDLGRTSPDYVIRACNRANVSVYATNAELKPVAEATGGRLIQGDLTRGLGDVLDDEAKSYVLGFTPVESPVGSCHSLRVRTVRSGLQVTARDGYCNTEEPDLLAGKVEGKALELSAAGTAAGSATASMQLPYFYDSPGIALVDLVMALDVSALKFTRQDGKEHADLTLVGFAYAEDGSVAARFSDSVPLDLDGAQVDAFRKRPYRYERQFRLPAGKYTVRVSFGSGDQSIGKAEAPLAIDSWDGHSLSLGGIALSNELKQVAGAADLDPALLEGRKDLISGPTQLVPSGDNRFRASEPFYAYVEIYNSSGKWELDARVRDRATGAERLSLRAVSPPDAVPAPQTPLILRLNDRANNALPPGDYILEIRGTAFAKTVEFHLAQ